MGLHGPAPPLSWPFAWLCFAAAPALASLACFWGRLISSGCVSYHSGAFIGLPAVPGTRAASLSWEAPALGGPKQSWATPSLGPVAFGVPTGDALRAKREGISMALPRLDPYAQGRLQEASCLLFCDLCDSGVSRHWI